MPAGAPRWAVSSRLIQKDHFRQLSIRVFLPSFRVNPVHELLEVIEIVNSKKKKHLIWIIGIFPKMLQNTCPAQHDQAYLSLAVV
jgi:hypothetical protein